MNSDLIKKAYLDYQQNRVSPDSLITLRKTIHVKRRHSCGAGNMSLSRSYRVAGRRNGEDFLAENIFLKTPILTPTEASSIEEENEELEYVCLSFQREIAVYSKIIPAFQSLSGLADFPVPRLIGASANDLSDPDEFIRAVHPLEEVEPYGVLVHDDLWTDNILFVNDSDACVFLDFALVEYGLPTDDIQYFMLYCLPALRYREEKTHYLDHYYDALKRTLQSSSAPIAQLNCSVLELLIPFDSSGREAMASGDGPSLETVCQAIQALYHSKEPSASEQASKWLGDLQSSVHAWRVADQLLHAKLSLETCYFAAQTMRSKMQVSFYELPPESHASLRDSLLQHLACVTNETNPVIITQLCLALSDLALQMTNWPDPLTTLFPQLTPLTLLEVATLLPQELGNRILKINRARNSEMLDHFEKVAPVVLDFLVSSAVIQRFFHSRDVCGAPTNSSGQWGHHSAGLGKNATVNGAVATLGHVGPMEESALCPRALACLGTWCPFIKGEGIGKLRPLLDKAFGILAMTEGCSSVTHERAADTICDALRMIEKCPPDREEFAWYLLKKVGELTTAYQITLQTEDMDRSMNLCRVFVELAESLLDKLISHPNHELGTFDTLELVLLVVDHPDYDVAKITFPFWYRLSEDVYQSEIQILNDAVRPFIERLISSLIKHISLEPDMMDVLSENDDFYEFRQRASDLVKDVVFIVGSVNCFRALFSQLHSQPPPSWEATEAALFVMQSVARSLLPSESEVVPGVVTAILSLPDETHVAVKQTSLILLGELCDWLEKHPERIEPSLLFLSRSLHVPKLAAAAAHSIQLICSSCRDLMGPHAEGILQVLSALDALPLPADAANGLIKGAATILSRLSPDAIQAAAKGIVSMQTAALTKTLQNGDHNRTDPVMWLDRLTTIFRHLNPQLQSDQAHPCSQVVSETLPVVCRVLEVYQPSTTVSERACRCLRFAVRCLGPGGAQLCLPHISPLLANLYPVTKHSCLIYLSSVLVDVYGTEKKNQENLRTLIETVLPPALELISVDGIRMQADTVDDLFRLATRIVQRCPAVFLTSGSRDAMMELALATVSLDHKDANASLMKFWVELIRGGKSDEEKEAISQLLANHGARLVSSILDACLFALPSFMIPDLADVVMDLMEKDRTHFCHWLEAALRELPKAQEVQISHEDLVSFHRAVTRSGRLAFAFSLYLSAVFGMEVESGYWRGPKQFAQVCSSVCAGESTVSISELDAILKTNRRRCIDLLINPPKSSASRQRVQASTTTPLEILGATRTLPSDIIEEAQILSDMCDLNEEVAAELLLLAESQSSDFPTVTRGLISVLLYYDTQQSIATGLLSAAQAVEGRTWTVDAKPEVTSLMTRFVISLVQEHGLPRKIIGCLQKLEMDTEMAKLEENRALGSRVHRGQVAAMFRTTRASLAKTLLAISAQVGLEADDLICLLNYLGTLDLTTTSDGTFDDVSLALFCAALFAMDATALRDQPAEATESLPMVRDPNFIPRVHEYLHTPTGEGAWWWGMRSALQLAWAISLRILGQFQDSETNTAFSEEDEALVDAALTGRPFRFLCVAVAGSSVLGKEEFCFRRLHGLVTEFLIGMPLKIKEMRNRADEAARLAEAHMQHGLDPPRNLPQDFSDLLTFLTKFYEKDRWGLRQDYWCPVDGPSLTGVHSMSQPPTATPKQVSLFKFLRIAGDLLPASLYSSYLDLLSTLSNTPETALSAFALLRSSSAPGRIFTIDHFFIALHRYYESLRQEQPVASRDTVYRRSLSRGISPMELRGLVSALQLIAAISRNNAIVATSIFSNTSWQPTQTLMGLVGCAVPTGFKGQLLTTLAAFVEGSAELAGPVWNCLEAAQVLHCLPTLSVFGPGGIKVELEEVETRNEEFPFTLAFVKLIKTLVTAGHKPGGGGLPLMLGSGQREPVGIDPYITFIIRSVFLRFPSWGYKDTKEMREVGISCLRVFNALLSSYSPDPSHFRPTGAPHPAFQLTALFLTPDDPAKMLLRLLDDCVTQLEMLRGPFSLGSHALEEVVEETLLEILRLLNRLMLLQGMFQSLVRETGSPVLLCSLDKIMLCSNPQTGRNDHPMSLFRLLPLHSSYPEATSLALSLMTSLLGPSGNHLLALLTEDPTQAALIRHGFVECIEDLLPLASSHFVADCALGVLQLLINAIERKDKGGWGLALFLLGFDLKQRTSSVILQDCRMAGVPRSCLHAVIATVMPSDDCPSAPPNLASSPQAAVLSYRLLYRLVAHPSTSSPVAHFLRNERDFFLRQLHILPLPQDGNDNARLEVCSWLLRLIAWELRTSALASPPHSSYQRKLIGLLIGSGGGDLSQSVLTTPFSSLSAPGRSAHSTAFLNQGRGSERRRLLALVSELDLNEPDVVPLQTEVFNPRLINEFLESDARQEESFVDLRLLHEKLMFEAEKMKQQRVASEERLMEEAETILHYALDLNRRIHAASIRAGFINGWKQVTEVLLCICQSSLLEGEIGQQLLVDTFHDLANKFLSPTVEASLLAPVSEVLFILLFTFRKMVESERQPHLIHEMSLEVPSQNLSRTPLDISTLLTETNVKELVSGMFGKLLDIMGKFRSSRQWVQVHLYASLLCLLQLNPGDKKWGQMILQHDALAMLCTDSLLGHRAVCLQALGSLTLLMSSNSPLINSLLASTFLEDLKTSLLRDDTRIMTSPASRSTSGLTDDQGAGLELVRGKLLLLSEVTLSSPKAARTLLEHGLMTCLMEMQIWRVVPEQEVSKPILGTRTYSAFLHLLACISVSLGSENKAWISQITHVLLITQSPLVLNSLKKNSRETLLASRSLEEGKEAVLLTHLTSQLGSLASPSVEDVSGLDLKPRLVRLSSALMALLTRLIPLEVPSLSSARLAESAAQEKCRRRNTYLSVLSGILSFAAAALKEDPLVKRRGEVSFPTLFSPSLAALPSPLKQRNMSDTSITGDPRGNPPLSVLVSLVISSGTARTQAVKDVDLLKTKLQQLDNLGTEALKAICGPRERADSLKQSASRALNFAISCLEKDIRSLTVVREQSTFVLWRHLEYYLIVLRASSRKQSFFSQTRVSVTLPTEMEEALDCLASEVPRIMNQEFFAKVAEAGDAAMKYVKPTEAKTLMDGMLRALKHVVYVQSESRVGSSERYS
ncbi:unnamed protein product [Cyprideis torosa]|uniref:Uncharacterized protein n=1 Tax=Cyprideis torosa TaxID=163714 RepID=A0A7R8W932_9CRUS|nr:unnamed protein product [Cyprideis torosa]CAG0883896.1 unnamed protein product [Cyprideis torosa]